ncbi:AAA domain-containing protein [Cupriavidus sp. AcVe19-6a]|uniref:AAA domain-containing protein n=1 Tax=Cupriavidus sp. AcVe19-6a TaxID=2821358 RepID=UPI001AEB3042|nr:AAA domain-containing protein [Cupriavidus sp. AcVe19-6a]MBP0639719.1 very short patch repair endonuclease [Cupriavidus sp. AcVe19-6a]
MSISPRELLHRLFVYIEEQLKDIDPRAFQIGKSALPRLFPKDLANLPGVFFDVQEEGDHVWLKVERLEEVAPPAPDSEKFGKAIRIESDPNGTPPQFIEAAIDTLIRIEQQDVPESEHHALVERLRAEAATALVAYVSKWQEWAARERPRRKTISLYGDLFALRHQLHSEQTAKPVEFVWGLGMASWTLSFEGKPFDFQYPLLTQPLEISLDTKSMSLEVRPRATEAGCEMDGFVACGIQGASECEKAMLEQLARHKDTPVSPFLASSYANVLKLVARSLDSRGSYVEVLAKGEDAPAAGEHLVVSDSWVVFARPKSNNFLVADLNNIRGKLEAGCEIPDGPLALVTPPSETPLDYQAVNFRGLSGRGVSGGSGAAEVKELYFPLPYNQEQVTIVQRLERAAGVTVQGPPGTGKTHTIANIICHYLATGKRVLVTSKGEPALEVLQGKIPKEVQPLTVALLAGDRDGIRQFQASIEAIQHQVSQLNPEATRDEIDRIHRAIDRTHHELVNIDRRVDEIAMQQLAEIPVDGASYRAEELAELVVKGAPQYAWFDDELSLEPRHAPPLTTEETVRLREDRRQLGEDLVYLAASLPSPDELPQPADIAQLHTQLCKLKSLDEATQTGVIPPLRAITPEVLQSARTLLAQLGDAQAELMAMAQVEGEWPGALRRKCAQPSFATEIGALVALFEDATRLVEARAAFMKRPVDFPAEALAHPKTVEAVGRAATTGKPFGFMAFGTGDAKEHVAKVKVNGLSPSTNDDWQHVQSYLKLHEQVLSFSSRWNPVAEVLELPSLDGGVARLRMLELVTAAAKKAHSMATRFDALLHRAGEAVFARAPATLAFGSHEDYEVVRSHIMQHLTRAELAEASIALSQLQERLAGKTGPVTQRLQDFVDQSLGNPGKEAARVAADYTELVVELRRVCGLTSVISRVKELAARLYAAGGANIAGRVSYVPVANGAEDSALPASWRDAWNWARMRTHLEKIEARKELVELNARRTDLEAALAQMYKDVVGKAAWLATKRNASAKVLQALAGYATAIRRIGKGTGPNAVRYRRDAQQSMLDAAGAVPCWIMSHAKISESMPADIGAFDLVIVDEASQSDLWALPAIVRAKKILVVGDDKQVSPDGSFVSSTEIDELRARFLSDQPYGQDMTPEKSLYDLAARVFAADQVMLREHFRCVPPIIAYSNQFYKGAIQPLRIPLASQRLDPPLIDIYVPGGMRDRHDCNRLEAEAIAAEISTILEDERFADRTIGVVSLLGMEQAKFIDTMVRERCSASELLRREFDCGDARTFQGSERDIMFLSMVADPERCHPLSGNAYDQRFNVAASRARDRMYLVRSVTAEQVSDKDIRMTLLEHFSKPKVTQEVDQDGLIKLCESGFEREVFTMLIQRGYRVIPQVKSGAYRLDMVVEGANDARLAIECDGDAYHGPERWASDMNRQRILERAGWTFWRCFASTWCLRKEEVFEELVERLTAMGIEPIGAVATLPRLVESRTWTFPTAKAEPDAIDGVIDAAIAAVKQKDGPVEQAQ